MYACFLIAAFNIIQSTSDRMYAPIMHHEACNLHKILPNCTYAKIPAQGMCICYVAHLCCKHRVYMASFIMSQVKKIPNLTITFRNNRLWV